MRAPLCYTRHVLHVPEQGATVGLIRLLHMPNRILLLLSRGWGGTQGGRGGGAHRLEVDREVLEVWDAVRILVAETGLDELDSGHRIFGFGLLGINFGLAQVRFDALDGVKSVGNVTKPACRHHCHTLDSKVAHVVPGDQNMSPTMCSKFTISERNACI